MQLRQDKEYRRREQVHLQVEHQTDQAILSFPYSASSELPISKDM